MGAVKSYMRGDIGGALKSVVGFGKKAMNSEKAQKQTRETKTSNADVVMWSGYVPSPLLRSSRTISRRVDPSFCDSHRIDPRLSLADARIRRRARTPAKPGKQQER